MADAEGPGKHRPRPCATRNTFADLGDTRGFRDPGELGAVYGLGLSKEGLYERTPIAVPETQPEEPDWVVKLDLLSQCMDLEHVPAKQDSTDGVLHEGEMKLVRLVNTGKMLLVYTPSEPNVLDLTGHVYFYALSAKTTDASLKARTPFGKDLENLKRPPPGSTIYLELVLGAAAPTNWVEVLPGLFIKWRLPNAAGLIITIGPEGKKKVVATVPDVTIKEPITKVSLASIHCGPDFQFARLLYSCAPVSGAYLEHLANVIGRRESLLKTLKL